jgi:hypothetical protein
MRDAKCENIPERMAIEKALSKKFGNREPPKDAPTDCMVSEFVRIVCASLSNR